MRFVLQSSLIKASKKTFKFKTSCTAEKSVCVEKIGIQSKLCQMPCQGIFADVKKSAHENITAENPEIFLERYKSFKKFFETSEGTYEIQSSIIPYKYSI